MINQKEKIIQLLSSKLGNFYQANSQIKFSCPKHSHHKKKLEVSVDKGLFHCWICGYGGSIFKLFSDLEIRESDLLKSVYGDKKEFVVSSQNKNIVHYLSEFVPYFSDVKNTGIIDDNINRTKRYLKSRHVFEDKIIKYSILSHITQKRIAIPSFDINGSMNGVTIKDIETGKYFNINDKSQPWNELYINWDEDLYIVEGIFDYLSLDSNCLCLLGSTIPDNSEILKKFISIESEIFLCLDKDANSKSIKIAKQLLSAGVKYVNVLNWNGVKENDIGEMKNTSDLNFDTVNISNINIFEIKSMMNGIFDKKIAV